MLIVGYFCIDEFVEILLLFVVDLIKSFFKWFWNEGLEWVGIFGIEIVMKFGMYGKLILVDVFVL